MNYSQPCVLFDLGIQHFPAGICPYILPQIENNHEQMHLWVLLFSGLGELVTWLLISDLLVACFVCDIQRRLKTYITVDIAIWCLIVTHAVCNGETWEIGAKIYENNLMSCSHGLYAVLPFAQKEEVGSRVETRRATLPFLTDSSRAHPAGSHWSAELIEGLS